jgi:hypothetical protein
MWSDRRNGQVVARENFMQRTCLAILGLFVSALVASTTASLGTDDVHAVPVVVKKVRLIAAGKEEGPGVQPTCHVSNGAKFEYLYRTYTSFFRWDLFVSNETKQLRYALSLGVAADLDSGERRLRVEDVRAYVPFEDGAVSVMAPVKPRYGENNLFQSYFDYGPLKNRFFTSMMDGETFLLIKIEGFESYLRMKVQKLNDVAQRAKVMACIAEIAK